MHVRKRIKMLPGQHVAKVSAFVVQGLAVAKEFCLILMEVGDNIIRMNMLFFLPFLETSTHISFTSAEICQRL